jgi:3-oxoisoapionate decarboxylase
MIGVLNTSLPGYEAHTPSEAIRAAKAHGLDALLFDNMLDVFPGLEPQTIERIAGEARAAGLQLATSIGFFNPANPTRCGALLAAGSGDINGGLLAAVDATRRLGGKTLFFMIGKIEDRDDGPISWQAQLDGVAAALLTLRPRLLESGVQLLLKTHEEMSTQEGVRIIERVGGDVLGISLDPVNLLCRIEDPVAAAGRAAGHIRQVHLDDAFVIFDGDKLRRYLAPIGQGEVEWAKLFELAPEATIWIEFHRGQFAMPVFDADWVAAQPDLVLDEYRGALAAALRNYKAETQHVDQFAPCDRFEPALAWLRKRGLLA